ncbi:MAG TPA: hypothetical protein VJS69_07705 [Candidatus Krumholzibacteria bacterium]|nr:hypothetical protein [Candidatus Krumholzibacteria bacterium]
MTNDDLTPEEREALSSLPRERTPSAGLEERVVAAMRERGHIKRKPARVIPITTTRVAGLLAACLVLMIGAYSIGLHNRVNNEVLKNIEPQPRSTSVTDEMKRDELSPPAANENALQKEKTAGVRPPSTLGTVEAQEAAPTTEPEAQFVDKKAPAFEPKLAVPQLASRKDAKQEARQPRDEVTKSMQKTFSNGIAKGMPGATDMPAPSSAPMPTQLRANASSVQESRAASAPPSSTRTFAINGGTLIVDAPDSLQIVTDEHGRTLVIYTSDGIIRIRLAN